MRTSRIIFEGGLEARSDESGAWSFLPIQATAVDFASLRLEASYGVRPILMIETHPSGKELETGLFSTEGGPAPNPMPLLDTFSPVSLITPFRSLKYVMGAVLYHFGQLARHYAETWRVFHANIAAHNVESDLVNFSQHGLQEHGYYEFDALVTNVVRCYETMRFPLWNVFGGQATLSKTGPRKGYARTLKACEGLPAELSTYLKLDWDKFGRRADAYRDFIHHYFPLDRGFSQSRMVRVGDNVWSGSMLIPDNPEEKSPRRFRFNSDIDALTFAWELTTQLLKLMVRVTTEIIAVTSQESA